MREGSSWPTAELGHCTVTGVEVMQHTCLHKTAPALSDKVDSCSDVVRLSGRFTSPVQRAVLYNYKRWSWPWGIAVGFHYKGSCALHEYAQETHPTFVYWPVKKLNEKSF